MNVLKWFGVVVLSILLFFSILIFGFVFMLHSTVLNPDFAADEVDKLNITAIVKTELMKQAPPEFQSYAPAIEKAISDVEPLIKQQARTAIYSGYDYIQGRSQHLSIVINLEPVKEKLKVSLREVIIQQLPAQIRQLPAAQIEQYYNQYYQQFASQIPSNYTIDENTIPPEARDSIQQVREGFRYYQAAYWGLVAFMVVLALGIIFIKYRVRGASRVLGVIFLICGALTYAGVYVFKAVALPQIPFQDLPSSIQPWVINLLRDIIRPLEWYSLGFLAAGIILVIISAVYPKPQED